MNKIYDYVYAISFLKMAIKIAGIPPAWIANNSKFWVYLSESTGALLTDSDGNYLLAE